MTDAECGRTPPTVANWTLLDEIGRISPLILHLVAIYRSIGSRGAERGGMKDDCVAANGGRQPNCTAP